MSKSPLLPKEYSDSGTQAAIFYALSPYKINDRNDIINPQLKWNLQQAWVDAGELLAKAHWKSLTDTGEEGFEISADADKEIENLNTMIAGIIAYEIMEPDSNIAIRRVEHKKGGEMTLVISRHVVKKLKELIPHLPVSGHSDGSKRRWLNIFKWKKVIKPSSNV